MHLEVENIPHNQIKNMSLAVSDVQYRDAHLHPEIELLLVLRGMPIVNIGGSAKTFGEKDVILINSNELHEIISENEPSTLLSLHILPQYFGGYFPQMERIKFEDNTFVSANKTLFIYTFCKLLKTYLSQEPYYQLQCAGLINIMVYDILQSCTYHHMLDDHLRMTTKCSRLLSDVIDFIEEYYAERLTLVELARHFDLSVSYLSHFIQKNLHQSFSEFLTYTRYLNAKALLMNSDLSLSDICYSCGFSDYRYMNKAFKKYTSCTPNEFKKKAKLNILPRTKNGSVKRYTPGEMMNAISDFLKENQLNEYQL